MFKWLRRARWRLLVFMFFVAVPAYGGYRLVEAAALGQVWNEKSDRWISYSAEPGRFLLKIAGWITAFIAPLIYIVARAKCPEWTQRIIDHMRLR